MSASPPPPLVSVVIVNYNRRDDLRQALLSVRRQRYPAVETIVVDNASTDGSRQMLQTEFPEVKLICSEQNLGMDGYSLGFAAARGEYLFQMDNDSEMPDAAVLDRVVNAFISGPANMAVLATRVEEYRAGIDDIEQLRRRDSRAGPINERCFHSGGAAFRKSMLDRVGYYNPDVFLYCSEMFLEIQFLAAGLKVLAYPEILMLHKASASARSELFVYYHVRNRLWYLRCFASAWQRTRYVPLVMTHALIQSIWRRTMRSCLRGIRHGLGPLPASLASTSRSNEPDFVRRVDDVGDLFRPARVLRSVIARLRGI